MAMLQGRHAKKLIGQAKIVGRNDDRGAEVTELRDVTGVEELGLERGCTPPQSIRGAWGSVVSSPSGVRGGALEAYGFSTFRALYCV